MEGRWWVGWGGKVCGIYILRDCKVQVLVSVCIIQEVCVCVCVSVSVCVIISVWLGLFMCTLIGY